jgi:hypothetical protein
MIVALALTFNAKGLLLLIGAIVFGILAVINLVPPPHSEWQRGLAYGAWCVGFIAWFIWAAGG